MTKFIQLTRQSLATDRPVYVNIDNITYFSPGHNDDFGDYTSICMVGGNFFSVKETAEEIFETIKDCNMAEFLSRR